ncbi:hypothetical protein C8R46DRAFT_1201681 [Mycena filopes]|nr:hypothetical protein C8R46DRAFT_1201681 [Mycena filopes]
MNHFYQLPPSPLNFEPMVHEPKDGRLLDIAGQAEVTQRGLVRVLSFQNKPSAIHHTVSGPPIVQQFTSEGREQVELFIFSSKGSDAVVVKGSRATSTAAQRVHEGIHREREGCGTRAQRGHEGKRGREGIADAWARGHGRVDGTRASGERALSEPIAEIGQDGSPRVTTRDSRSRIAGSEGRQGGTHPETWQPDSGHTEQVNGTDPCRAGAWAAAGEATSRRGRTSTLRRLRDPARVLGAVEYKICRVFGFDMVVRSKKE